MAARSSGALLPRPALPPSTPLDPTPAPSPTRLEQRVSPTDPVFDYTADLAATRRESNWRFAKAIATKPRDLSRALGRIRALPRTTIPVNSTSANRDLTELLRKGFGPWHSRSHAVAVLEIPTDPRSYTSGRSRQALRTNSAKARASGVHCATVSGQREIEARFGQIIVDDWGIDSKSDTYRGWLKNVADVPHALYVTADSADGRVLVFCKLVVDGNYARLHTFVHNRNDEAASPARFLLMDYLVEILAARGVTRLFVDTLVALPKGLRYFQHLVGYRAVNVSLSRRAPVPTTGRDESIDLRRRAQYFL
jgi:hypothetical protein